MKENLKHRRNDSTQEDPRILKNVYFSLASIKPNPKKYFSNVWRIANAKKFWLNARGKDSLG